MPRAQMPSDPQFPRTSESQWRPRHRAMMITPHRKPKGGHSGEAQMDGGAGASLGHHPPSDPGWARGREAGPDLAQMRPEEEEAARSQPRVGTFPQSRGPSYPSSEQTFTRLGKNTQKRGKTKVPFRMGRIIFVLKKNGNNKCLRPIFK